MNIETFNKLLDELDGNSLETLKKKNAMYASSNDCLHNFDSGAEIMGLTPAQCAWGYMTKHLVALRDKVKRNDFSDREDLLEKCQDIINYIRFIWLIGNDDRLLKEFEKSKYSSVPTESKLLNLNYVIFCKYYESGKCLGTKEKDPCNLDPVSKTCRVFK